MFFEIGKYGIDFSFYLFGLDTDLKISAPAMWLIILSVSALRVRKIILDRKAKR